MFKNLLSFWKGKDFLSEVFDEFKDMLDDSEAKSTWDYHIRMNKNCDRILEKLANSDLSVNEAVCFALTARYFKRTVSHLVNIATSVILPLSDLDYYDERIRTKQS